MLDNQIKQLQIGEEIYREKVVALLWTAASSLKTMQPSKACFWPSNFWWLEQICWLYPPFCNLELISRKQRRTCLAGASYVVTICSGSQMMRLGCPATLQDQWTVWFLVGAWALSLSTTSGSWFLWATMKASAYQLCWFSKGNTAPGMEYINTGAVLSPCFCS